MNIEKKFRELLNEYAIVSTPANEINLDEKVENVFVNSILFIKIVVALETEFEFEFEEEDLDTEGYSTLRDVITYIEKRLMQKEEEKNEQQA